MNLLISDNTRCAVSGDGLVWSPVSVQGYLHWQQYLDQFEEVRVLVRARPVSEPPSSWVCVSGPGVRAMPMPYFVGPWELTAKYFAVRSAIRGVLRDCDAISMRVPATLSQLVWGELAAGRPYGVHVTGDPHEALAPGLLADPSRALFRKLYSRRLVTQIARACAVAYVTSESLQRKYPPPPGRLSVDFSDVLLPDDAWVSAPREARKKRGSFKLVMVGSFAHLIKAPDVLVEAIAICVRAGLNLSAVIVGEGAYRPKIEDRCRALGIYDRISFTGQLASVGDVRTQLDLADLFVLPSKTEGLPRAMIEAMARALPCVGTAVGGIPELLPPEDLVAPGDAGALARKIEEVSADPERLARMSARNLHRCQAYRHAEISALRGHYCSLLRQKTEEWLRTRSN